MDCSNAADSTDRTVKSADFALNFLELTWIASKQLIQQVGIQSQMNQPLVLLEFTRIVPKQLIQVGLQNHLNQP